MDGRAPNFFVFEDGEIVDRIGGWGGDSKKKIVQYLEQWGRESPSDRLKLELAWTPYAGGGSVFNW